MKGLLIKDFKLIKNQKHFFIAIIAISVIFVVTDIADMSFIVSYLSFISVLFVVSSISYDEFNNGFAYLMTLPTTRKTYVLEKFVFGFIIAASAWVSSVLLTTIFHYVKDVPIDIRSWILTCLMLLAMVLLMFSIILPVQLKFGQNKGNIAMIIVVGGCFIIGYGLKTLFEIVKFDVTSLINIFEKIGILGSGCIAVLVIALCLYISYRISSRIMLNKEF